MTCSIEKTFEKEDQEFISGVLGERGQFERFKGWCQLSTASSTVKERIIVVSNFRLLSIKKRVMGHSIRQNYALLDLVEIVAQYTGKDEPAQISFMFDEEPLKIVCYNPSELIQSILFSVMSITHGFPADMLPKIDVPVVLLEDFRPPAPDSQDGLLAHYMARCDYLNVAQRPTVLDHLIASFESQTTHLDLGACFVRVDKCTAPDIKALAEALKYTDLFDELIIVESSFGDDGLQALAGIFRTNKHIKSLILSKIKAQRTGFQQLADELSRGCHQLEHLTVSKNAIGDSGMKKLCIALANSKQPLKTLFADQCSLSTKGIKYLANLLSQPDWNSSLKALDISDNSMGKHGSQAIATWLENAHGLHVFNCVRSDLETEHIFNALIKNKDIPLRRLNVSGNKIGKKAVMPLAKIIAITKTLNHIYLSKTQINKTRFEVLIKSALANKNGMQFVFNFSHNDLSQASATTLVGLVNSNNPSPNIAGLLMRDTGLKLDGIVSVCKAAEGLTKLKTLVLDQNLKTGVFKSVTPAGEAIAALMDYNKSIKVLSLVGDDNCAMKHSVIPVFKALKQNTTLTKLDVRHNKIPDDAFHVLSTNLRENKSLRSIRIDENKISLKLLQFIADSINNNTTLVDPAIIPINDIGKLVNSSNKRSREQLRQLVENMESCVLRNERNAGRPWTELLKLTNDDDDDDRSEDSGFDPVRGYRRGLTTATTTHKSTYSDPDVAISIEEETLQRDRSRSREDILRNPHTRNSSRAHMRNHSNYQPRGRMMSTVVKSMIRQVNYEANGDDGYGYKSSDHIYSVAESKENSDLEVDTGAASAFGALTSTDRLQSISPNSNGSPSHSRSNSIQTPSISHSDYAVSGGESREKSPANSANDEGPLISYDAFPDPSSLASPLSVITGVSPQNTSPNQTPMSSLKKRNKMKKKGGVTFEAYNLITNQPPVFYPPSKLKTGAIFPNDVSLTDREIYLSDSDFWDTFKMGKEQFAEVPFYKQQQLKRGTGLL